VTMTISSRHGICLNRHRSTNSRIDHYSPFATVTFNFRGLSLRRFYESSQIRLGEIAQRPDEIKAFIMTEVAAPVGGPARSAFCRTSPGY
jgi:hypothetical protein